MRSTLLPALALAALAALVAPAAAGAAGPHDPDVWVYAKKCFDRIGLVDRKDLAGPFKCKAPDAKRLVTQVDGHVKDIGVCDPKAGTCPKPTDPKPFPDECDYPAWLELSSQSCYGNTYVQKIEPKSNPNIVGAMLCRHKWSWSDGDDDFEDIAMIIHNRKNGETCWFQTDDSEGIKLDGRAVPGPETVRDHSFWLRPIQTASVGCVGCHDNGPFMNSRWMNKAIDLSDSEDEPYRNSEPPFDRWPVPRFVKSDQAGACQSCHKIAAGGRHLIALDPADPAETIPVEFQTCADCNAICAAMPGTERCRRCRGWIQRVTGQTTTATKPRGANAKALSDEIALWMPDTGTHTRADWNKDYATAVDHLMKCCAEVGATKPGAKPKLAGCSEFAPKVGPAIATVGGTEGEDIYAEIDQKNEAAHGAALDESFATREIEMSTRDASPDQAALAVTIALPLDTDPLPPELAASARESLSSAQRKLAAFPKDERVACFLQQLERDDADDRVIPWTRICPAQGPDGPVCRASSVGEAAIASIGSPEQVDAANSAISSGRRFIVHLRSDLLRKDATQPASVYERPNQALMVHHLKQLARDVALADTKLAAGAGGAPGYANVKAWIDARKRDPKSVYKCLAGGA